MFKVNNKNNRWRRSGVFIVNFEHISHLFLVFILLTLNKQMFSKVFLKTSQNFKHEGQRLSPFHKFIKLIDVIFSNPT